MVSEHPECSPSDCADATMLGIERMDPTGPGLGKGLVSVDHGCVSGTLFDETTVPGDNENDCDTSNAAGYFHSTESRNFLTCGTNDCACHACMAEEESCCSSVEQIPGIRSETHPPS